MSGAGGRLGRLGQVTVLVAVFVAAGAGAAVLWQLWWTPPTGIVSGHEFFLDEVGVGKEFSGTGLYVLAALAVGGVVGVLVGLATRRRELLTLVVTLLAAGLGGWVMAQVGHALGPPDPTALASTLEDLSPLEADLRVSGLSPYLALPIGALLGLGVAMAAEPLIGMFLGSGQDPPGNVSA